MTTKATKSTKSKAKYRVSFTESELLHIDRLARLENPISTESISLIAKLAPTLAKIAAGSLTPAYTIADKKSLSDSLGIPTSANNNNNNNNNNNSQANTGTSSHLTKEEIWERDYLKYSQNPECCTATEIANAKEHMYLNDLMSPEEVKEWEAKS